MNRRFPRTRTGCVSCRQRKKKCDETKPQCRACVRNKLKCTWPPHIVRIFGLDPSARSPDGAHLPEPARGRDSSYPGTNKALPSKPPASVASMDSNISSSSSNGSIEDKGNYVASWSSELKAFLSPRRAGMLLPESQILLSHYLENTGPKLAPAPDVPWISWLLPVAYNDDLLMNSILALSGGHLLYKLPNNHEIEHATYRHYSLAVQTLSRVVDDDTTLFEPLVLLRVVLTILILFHYEVISENMDGSPFSHLRASRHLILHLRHNSHQHMSTSERKLLGFVAEVYSYIVLSNSITPFGMNCDRTLIYDPFLRSLDDLRDLGAFGVMFSGVHDLFELISSVSLFAGQQASRPLTDNDLPPDCLETYNRLRMCIGYLGPLAIEHEGPQDHNAAREVFRIALLVFLETSISPFSKHDSVRVHHLQPFLDRALHYLPQILLSNYSCISMWPNMIIGSCLVREEQREVITSTLTNNHYLMRNTGQGSALLRLLWNDPDEYCFGPYGLGLLMERHGMNYGII